jgi:hypothetical protein
MGYQGLSATDKPQPRYGIAYLCRGKDFQPCVTSNKTRQTFLSFMSSLLVGGRHFGAPYDKAESRYSDSLHAESHVMT